MGTGLNCLTECEAFLTSTHIICFGAIIRKIVVPLHTPVLLYKSGVYGGIFYTECYPDGYTVSLSCRSVR